MPTNQNTENYKVNRKLPVVKSRQTRLSLFDADNPDLKLFNCIDAEGIALGGSPIRLFLYNQSDQDYDEVYMEAIGKPISKEGIRIMCHYEPKMLEEPLGEFGIELTNDQIFTFNKSDVVSKIGRDIIPHDVIQPEFQNQKYEIFEVQEDSFESYGIYHLVCSARLLRDTEEIQNAPLTKKEDRLPGIGGYEDD